MNLVTQEKTKELTDQQKTFLNALFGEANGSPKLAGEIAGYSEHSYPKVVKSLKHVPETLAINKSIEILGIIYKGKETSFINKHKDYLS